MIIIFFSFLVLLISQVIDFSTLKSRIGLILTVIIFLAVTINITYTADWFNYSNIFYDSNRETKDFFIKYISVLFSKWGLEYRNVFQLHVILISVFYTLFARKFLPNPFLAVILFLFLTYVPLVNQIRYFLAFSLFLFAIYNFYFENTKKFYLYSVFALLNHIGTLPLFFILIFLKKDFKLKYYFVFAIAVYIVMYVIMSISYLSELGGFNIYIREDMRTSFLGGLLKILPSIIPLFLLIRLKSKLVIDEKTNFLYKVSIFPIVFMPSATLTQIIGDRYVFIFSFVWLVLFVMYLYKSSSKKYLLLYKTILVSFSFLIWFIMYYLPVILFGQSHLLEELVKTFESQF